MSEKLVLQRWTRDGILTFSWSPFETVEKLVLATPLREKLESLSTTFHKGQAEFHALKLTWRQGVFFYGASGTGKSAASRALARSLGWPHLTVPAHEILDSHLFERALAEATVHPERVIVLEDVDLIIARMEPHVFFTLLDHAMERADGTFWVATSRHAENTPKTQLVRPGRFEEMIRLDTPSAALRKEVLAALLSVEDEALQNLVENTEGLTFSHFEEMRQVAARLRLQGRENETWHEVQAYIQDQIISGDRLGGLSDLTDEMNERVRHADPRVLLAALQMTDVFRTLIEKTIADAAESAKKAQVEGE